MTDAARETEVLPRMEIAASIRSVIDGPFPSEMTVGSGTTTAF